MRRVNSGAPRRLKWCRYYLSVGNPGPACELPVWLRQPCRVNGENFSDAALVVLGHGTTQNDRIPPRRCISTRRNCAAGKFSPPSARRSGNRSRKSKRFCRKFPRRACSSCRCSSAKATSARSHPARTRLWPINSSSRTPNSELFYCRPVGSHDSMTGVILARANEIVNDFPFRARRSRRTSRCSSPATARRKMKIHARPSSGRSN
jgi:hypothetical protein